MALFIIIYSACLYCTNNVCFFASSSMARFGYWPDCCQLVIWIFSPLSEAEFMVKDAETKSEMPNLLMPVAVVARVILPKKYDVVKCSTDPRGQAGHKEPACKKGFLGGLEYLLQLRGNRFATAWKDHVVFPVVSAYNSDQNYQLRRFASFDRCPRDRLPPDCRWICRLVSSGYFFDEAAQTILCFACGRPYPSHAPDCGREHGNDTSFPPPLSVGTDGDVADVGMINVQVRPSREDLRLLLNDNTASASIVRVAVPETGSEGGDVLVTTSAADANGLIENQVCVLFIVFLLTLYVCLAVSVSFFLCLPVCLSLSLSLSISPLSTPISLSLSLM